MQGFLDSDDKLRIFDNVLDIVVNKKEVSALRPGIARYMAPSVENEADRHNAVAVGPILSADPRWSPLLVVSRVDHRRSTPRDRTGNRFSDLAQGIERYRSDDRELHRRAREVGFRVSLTRLPRFIRRVVDSRGSL